jgi:hypothetical protein
LQAGLHLSYHEIKYLRRCCFNKHVLISKRTFVRCVRAVTYLVLLYGRNEEVQQKRIKLEVRHAFSFRFFLYCSQL